MTHNNALRFNQYTTTRPKFTLTTSYGNRDAAMVMAVGRPLKDAATICI